MPPNFSYCNLQPVVSAENLSNDERTNPSYVKLAKQFISNVKQSTQKFINDVDPAKCQSLPSKISAIAN